MPLDVVIDTSGFDTPVGEPARVSATVTCRVPLGDLVVPGLPGATTVRVTVDSPLDHLQGALMPAPLLKLIRLPGTDVGRRAAAGARRDEGAVSIFIVAIVPVFVIAAGLGFDLAARVAHPAATRTPWRPRPPAPAESNCRPVPPCEASRHASTPPRQPPRQTDWLRESGVTGTVQVRRGTIVEVTVRDTYRPRFLSIIGITSLPVEAHASARVVRARGRS